ncbi:unnamed protein product [Arabis nemorensis]|uniref:RRM domain-containing protein n=1 Tax=Arabis nemorensis TaxID=586526 RepID=A0A565C4A1_9BRAS|nr:unnamed protein product [Arabis nemorensis]
MRDAIKEMNDHGQKNIGFQCFVHGLDCDTDAKCLPSEFSVFGEIIYDHETVISKGFGFVTYKDETSMRDVIMLMDGDEIDGCYINVEEARRRNGFFHSSL